ncbi:MAG: hypothetical protein GTN38_02320 [Candidatus Aenigmarchaeota archaeon]|nr:hypothetical protein [Candidatus Aenigmarchaeota archaeon]NIP40388.1 hypothetical protein [Candidatus Aenigmarchaeota archaeon]NIQ18314.1 hypothetical protein [Candidatus Aenigmarchaeota archaeon]NIS73266.1 hypothetical protein [Candidatus Aenigmarchaeota archaeon]
MKKILDIGSSCGSWALMQALENPEHVYVNVDIDQKCYKINSPETAYRFLIGQAVLRAQERLELDPNDRKTGGAVLYLGQEFVADGGGEDNLAIGILENQKDGIALLNEKADIPFGDYLGMNGKTIRELLQEDMPEETEMVLEARMQNVYHVVGDLNQLPFKNQSLDYVRSSGTSKNYERDSAIGKAQEVLKSGKIKKSVDGIKTVF